LNVASDWRGIDPAVCQSGHRWQHGTGQGRGRKFMRTRLVENPVSASARWCASGRNRWKVIAIGGNARNTGPKQGFDGPGRERTAVSRYSIPRKTFGTSIDVISARKVATDDQRSTQEHGRSLQPVDTGPTKSTRLVTATGPFHLLNHGLRSMFAPLQRRDQGAFATRIRSLPNHIVMRSPSAYSRVARLMVPDLLHTNRDHFYRDVIHASGSYGSISL
jgi:hypothetical protein